MIAKPRFRKWLVLEDYKKKIFEATERSEFPDRVFAYLSVAFDSVNESEPWQNTVFSFAESAGFQVNKIPLTQHPSKEEKPAAWDYEGRTWAYWCNLFAKTYGWTSEYIADLDVDEALGLAQEILTDGQLDREFLYGLSEIAYPYNPSTKKNVFKPLPRPYWMKESAKPIKTFRYSRDLLPVGAIQDISGMPQEYNPLRGQVEVVQKKTETKETNAQTNP